MAYGGLIAALVALAGGNVHGDEPGGFTPEEAVKRMVVPKGFHVEIYAAEPMVRQPVTASFNGADVCG